MSKSLQDRIADAISEISAHILLHGRDMYGETVPLVDAQDVLRDCATALKKAAAPPQKAPEPVAFPAPPSAAETVTPASTVVKAAGTAGAKGRAAGA